MNQQWMCFKSHPMAELSLPGLVRVLSTLLRPFDDAETEAFPT